MLKSNLTSSACPRMTWYVVGTNFRFSNIKRVVSFICAVARCLSAGSIQLGWLFKFRIIALATTWAAYKKPSLKPLSNFAISSFVIAQYLNVVK